MYLPSSNHIMFKDSKGLNYGSVQVCVGVERYSPKKPFFLLPRWTWHLQKFPRHVSFSDIKARRDATGSRRPPNRVPWGRGRSREATGGEPSPSLASAASRRVGPCTRSVVQRSCTGGPGAASASVTLGRHADSERSGPSPPPPNEMHSGDCFGPAGLAMTA